MKQKLIGSYQKLRATNILSNFLNLSSIQLSNILLLMLIFPIIARKIGIEAFGFVTLANTFATLAGVVINYGINQSGIRDVAMSIKDKKKLSIVFYNALWIRAIIFILYLVFLYAIQWWGMKYYSLIILATPLVIAEILNPLFFFIGTERLKIYNIANVVTKVISILSLVIFIKSSADAGWVNFILGLAGVVTYVGLLIYGVKEFKLSFSLPVKADLLKLGKDNFYLTANNISVQLQQSIMIFALGHLGNPEWLGAYALCDKVIQTCRMLIISVSNAIYPKSVQIYQQGAHIWALYRKKTKWLITGVFFMGSLSIFILADFIIYVISGQHDHTAVIFLRIMCWVPAVAALNFINVIDQLLKNNTAYIFRIAIVLLGVSLLLAYTLFHSGWYILFASFTLILEICGLLMYEYTITKPARNNA
ncbi:MAG: oligosaccharide flippase family protein [Mucilaginibacter sp.]|uniref:oligosaccharide flippase family protein n=1 Tax=Mucilaginibacter sp. TaxID=1882438 RepID=UPI0031A2E0C7